jgi:type IV secretory pathway VirB2 component (pilin)
MAQLRDVSNNALTIVASPANSAITTIYDSAARETSFQGKQTFMATGTFTPPATPTDLIMITGSATKTIRVVSMVIGTTATANGSANFFLAKRSVMPTGGAFTKAQNILPVDANNAAATANVGHWGTTPTAPTAQNAGLVWMKQVAVPAAVPASFAGQAIDGVEMMRWNQNLIIFPIVLRGPNQTLTINFAGATLISGQTHAYTITWFEE